MPGPLIDCYVLAQGRDARTAMAFLDLFMPDRETTFDEDDLSDVLGIPKGSSILEALLFLEANPNIEYTMYWRNSKQREPYHAILAFNGDGSLVLGLSPCIEDKESTAMKFLAKMEAFAGTGHGLWGVETPPPEGRGAFRSTAKR